MRRLTITDPFLLSASHDIEDRVTDQTQLVDIKVQCLYSKSVDIEPLLYRIMKGITPEDTWRDDLPKAARVVSINGQPPVSSNLTHGPSMLEPIDENDQLVEITYRFLTVKDIDLEEVFYNLIICCLGDEILVRKSIIWDGYKENGHYNYVVKILEVNIL